MNFSRMNMSTLSKSAFVLLFVAATLPVQAGIVNEPDPSLGGKTNLNVKTGIKYWIELSRQGKTMRVTNQQKFISGDKIRFHVQPTVDGFAYIVLRSGSQGEQAVLFPLEKSKDDNRLHRETDYALPSDDYLTFDSHPGTEKVTLLFSKTAIDSSKVLSSSSSGSNHVILRATSGSKDLIPAHTSVVYQASEPANPDDPSKPTGNTTADSAAQAIADAASGAPSSPPTFSQTVPTFDTKPPERKADAKVEPKADQPAIAQTVVPTVPTPVATSSSTDSTTGNLSSSTAASTTKSTAPAGAPPTVPKIAAKLESGTSSEGGFKSSTGAVLVRQDDADKVLHIDVDLEHSGS